MHFEDTLSKKPDLWNILFNCQMCFFDQISYMNAETEILKKIVGFIFIEINTCVLLLWVKFFIGQFLFKMHIWGMSPLKQYFLQLCLVCSMYGDNHVWISSKLFSPTRDKKHSFILMLNLMRRLCTIGQIGSQGATNPSIIWQGML